MLVDGGYVNNIPFDIMEELYDPAVTIVVNVEATGAAQKLDTLKVGSTFLVGGFSSAPCGVCLVLAKVWSYQVLGASSKKWLG